MQIEYRIFFWLFVTAFCLLYLYFFINSGIYLLQHDPKAMDFLAFFSGAQVLSIAPTNLYNLHLQQDLQQHIDPIVKTNSVFLPFLNPPFVAFMFQMVAIFGLIHAYVIVLGINMVLLGVVCFLFIRQNRKIKWYYSLGFTFGVITFIPILITLLVGQLSIFLCVIFFFAWVCLKKGQAFRSGLILSLILIKPQFFLLPFLAILVQRRSKLIIGFVLGTAFLIVFSCFYIGWTGMYRYLLVLYSFYKTGTGYNINLMAQQSIQTLLLILFHTQTLAQIRVYWILAILSIIIPTLFIWSKKFSFSSSEFSLQFALLIIATLITSPHTHFYDVSLLLIISMLLLSQMHVFNRRQKRLYTIFVILNYCIPLFGYCLFVWLPDTAQGIWVIPTVMYLIIFWLVIFKELVTVKRNKGELIH